MHRIYFDTNEGYADGAYDLGIPGSLDDMKPIAGELRDGLRVRLYMSDEVEVDAILKFNVEDKRWMAYADLKTLWTGEE